MADEANYIGIDLGGTHVRAACVDAAGRIRAVDRQQTSKAGPDAVIRQIVDLVSRLREPDSRGIGIGVPGAIDATTGRVLNIPALASWTDVPLAEEVSRVTGLPCVLENDAKAAALGEWWAGAGQGCADLAYVTVGTGIGGGIIVDGRLLRGVGGLAGEVGHTHVTDSSQQCACGRFGCWQAVASGTALAGRAQAAIAIEPTSRIAVLAGDQAVTAFHVAQAAREDDSLALALLAEFAQFLGMGFANIQHCYSPSRIIMGGGMATLFGLLETEMTVALRAGLLPGFPPAQILPAALGDDAGLVGAAIVAAD
jgi:glucokinase